MGQFGVGQGVTRLEDARLLQGQGCYTDDLHLDGELFGVVLRSPYANAAITSIDLDDAKAMPGVKAIYTGEDLKAAGIGGIPVLAVIKGKEGEPVKQPPYPALAQGRVRFVGQPVAFVVAETLAEARDAAELIMVDYADEKAVIDADKALEPGAPQVHEEAPGNLALDWEQGDAGGVAAAFEKAAHIAEIEIVNNRVVVNAMEPRVNIADYDPAEERFTLYTGSQGHFRLMGQLTQQILKIPDDKLRIVTRDVGGGFGMKIFCYPEQVLSLFAARDLESPVRWTGERSEGFLSDTQGRDHITRARMAMDGEGRFLGVKIDTAANIGAYVSNFGVYIPTSASTQMYSGLYRIPAIHAEVKCAFTHTVPVDAYRGAGRPEASYTMERLVDECARVMGMDRREIRLKNFIRPEDIPYDTGLDRIYDSGDYPRLLKEASQTADWEGFETRRAESAQRGKLRGIGLASYVEACGGIGMEEADITLDADGGVTLIIGTMTNGQGHHTAYAQLLNDKLGIDLDKVRMIQGDSEIVKRGGGTGGSRSLIMGGTAVNRAGDKIIETAKSAAGHLLEAATADIDFEDGVFSIVGTDRRVTLGDVAKAAAEGQLPAELEIDGPIHEVADYTAEALTFPNGCHICELEVDPDTGVIEIQRYVVADDFGTIVNPLLVAGQVHGGIAQGLGQALLEHTVYDEDGQLLSASFMDYCMPRADDMPEMEIKFIQDMPCTTNPLGAKGAGEAGAIGAPPAIMNALCDALSPLGQVKVDMPATPEKVWQAIQRARASSRASTS